LVAEYTTAVGILPDRLSTACPVAAWPRARRRVNPLFGSFARCRDGNAVVA